MHSPEAVAFKIYLGKRKKKNGQYRDAIITIWHKHCDKSIKSPSSQEESNLVV